MRQLEQPNPWNMLAKHSPEDILDTALNAISTASEWRSVLDALPAAIYVTDANGAVTYWNRACAELAGREPRVGEDRFCVTWQLYTTTGDPLPPDRCPMARAIQERRQIRDEIVIVARPDGRRAACRPYPTPLLDEHGEMNGAINMVIDVTAEQTDTLIEQAERCRRLASALYSREAAAVLESMAQRFEQTAAELRAGNVS